MAINTWMPVYTRDILASCADMSAAQFGGYMRMLLYAWESGGLPNDMEACCRVAGGLSPTDWQVVRKRLVVLDAGTSDERLSHPRLEAERSRQQQGYDRKVEAIAKARKARSATVVNTDHSIDHSIDHSVVVNAVNKAVNKREPEPEPEPDTLKSISNGRAKSRPPKATKISWTAVGGFANVCDISRAAWKAAFPLIDIDRELAKCHSYAVAKPAYARKRDWNGAIRNWLSNAQENAELSAQAAQASAPKPVFRADAGREMTASEYAEWRQGQMRREYERSKARKRGLSTLGDSINERLGANGSAAGSDG